MDMRDLVTFAIGETSQWTNKKIPIQLGPPENAIAVRKEGTAVQMWPQTGSTDTGGIQTHSLAVEEEHRVRREED